LAGAAVAVLSHQAMLQHPVTNRQQRLLLQAVVVIVASLSVCDTDLMQGWSRFHMLLLLTLAVTLQVATFLTGSCLYRHEFCQGWKHCFNL
jgi:hypothetical protein